LRKEGSKALFPKRKGESNRKGKRKGELGKKRWGFGKVHRERIKTREAQEKRDE